MASIISATTTNGLSTSADNSGSLQLATNNGTTAVTIDTSQNFFVNKTAYSDTSGNGFGVFPNSGIPQVSCVGAANSTQKNFTVYSSTDSAYKFYVDYAGNGYYAGNLLIGTTTLSGGRINAANGTGLWVQKLQDAASNGAMIQFLTPAGSQAGSITISGTTTSYGSGSDYRLKDEIQPLTNALSKVELLKPVMWKWKADNSNGQGFIAHELAEIVPDAVVGEKDAVDEEGKIIPQMVDTSFLVATLTAAIQELKAELDATKAEVQALKGVA